MPNKKSQLNLLPVVVLVLVAIVAGYFLINGDLKFPKFNREPQVRRLNGFPTVTDVTSELDKQRVVIKNNEELQKFLNYVDKSGLVTLRENINFEKEYLIGVSSTTQNEEGLGLKIKKLYEDKATNSLLVQIEQTENPDGCKPIARKTLLVDVVAISKTDKNISFEVVKKTNEECPVVKSE